MPRLQLFPVPIKYNEKITQPQFSYYLWVMVEAWVALTSCIKAGNMGIIVHFLRADLQAHFAFQAHRKDILIVLHHYVL